jgi:hypothetical protein
MKSVQVGLLSLGCVGGAFAFGLVANAAIDLVMPAEKPAVLVKPVVKPAEQAQVAPAPAYTLASTSSTPVDLGPVKVKTIPIVYHEERAEPAAAPQRMAAVPLPRPRPASAPVAIAMDAASIARQPASLAISAATHKLGPEDGEVLGAAGIERMRTALALTAEQEEYWPAIASELRALGKVLKVQKGRSVNLDDDTIQRLYWAAAPLISRLSYEQKEKVKQMAHVMGLHQVAAAL